MPAPRLASEDVIINAPMSYTGSAQRILRLRRRGRSQGVVVALIVLAVVLVAVAWLVVTVWYVVTVGLLGIVTVPYRLLRRGSRKRKAEARRHRELLAAVQRERP